VLDEAALGALFTPAEQHTPEQASRVALDDTLIAEVQAADVLVLGVPMYKLRRAGAVEELDRCDCPCRPSHFRYTENGPEGLLKGKKVYVALARGGRHRNTPADSQVPFLKTVLGFLGMSDVHFIYAEGLSMGPEAAEQGFAEAEAELDAAFA